MAGDLPATTWERALAWRLQRHCLVGRAAPADLPRVAGEICGLHAQVLSSAELSLWARIDGLQRDAVQDALWKHRTLVKLWAMRGTLHLLPSAEFGLWVSALSTYSRSGNAGSPKMDVLAEAVGRALDGRLMTREELALEVEHITASSLLGEWVRSGWGWGLKPASFRGSLCFAPSQDGRVRFTAPAKWIPTGIRMPGSVDGLREVTRRFLSAYGPLTAEDLTWWWVDGRRKGAQMLAALGEEAVEVDVEGLRAWMLARDVHDMMSVRPASAARLLPAFDPWVMGSSRQHAALAPEHRPAVYRGQGWVSPVLLVNGRVAGIWRHKRKARRLSVEIEPFGRLPAWAHAQLEAEMERLAAYFDCELSAKWGGH